MANDWPGAALDDLWSHEALMPTRAAAAGSSLRRESRGFLRQVHLPSLCLLTGAMASLLFGWPLLMLLELIDRGPHPSVFWAILGGAALVFAVVALAITTREQRHWAQSWMNVSAWVDPPPWK